MKRRDFIRSGLGTAALGMTVGFPMSSTSAATAKPGKIPFALQINSIAPFASKDFAAAMKRVATLGFTGVEFAGYYGKKADFLRKVLDDLNLKVVGTHLGVEALLGDRYFETVKFNKTLGNPWLVVGHGLAKVNSTDAGNRMAANLMNELARKAKKDGMFVSYHPHADDFVKVKDMTAWDLFFSRTTDDVLMQMDLANAIEGGADPYESMAKFAKRNTIVHLKASGPNGSTVCGPDDKVDWKRVFRFCEETAQSQWYILEQYPAKGVDHFAAVTKSVEAFKKMGKW